MNFRETSKFCAGSTVWGRNVESIHHAPKIATTGTPAAFPGKLAGDQINQFDLWAIFALVVACFGLALIEDKIGGETR